MVNNKIKKKVKDKAIKNVCVCWLFKIIIDMNFMGKINVYYVREKKKRKKIISKKYRSSKVQHER